MTQIARPTPRNRGKQQRSSFVFICVGLALSIPLLPLPKGSPFTTVQGTVGGVAYADGHAYTALAPDKVAHTFTIPQLHINVPLPGDTTTGKPYGIVSFTFRTGAAGSYYFQCFDPCGTGASGWEGPMTTKGYMRGTLTVRA